MNTIPNTTGTNSPALAVPQHACDAHIHIVDARFEPAVPGTKLVEGATVTDYRLLQQRIGVSRAVVVQPKCFGTNNDCTLDAVKQLGENGRGIAVVQPEVSDTELKRLDVGGIRGLRFSVWNPTDTVTTVDMIKPLAGRIHDLGWNAQLHMSGDQIVANEALIKSLPCTVVFDHMGRMAPELGPKHPAFAIICRMLDTGRAWVKLSGAYLNTKIGGPEYADATAIAKAFAAYAPERMVWGSDWPHVTEKQKPDDAVLIDLLSTWVADAKMRQRILVDNPAELYGF